MLDRRTGRRRRYQDGGYAAGPEHREAAEEAAWTVERLRWAAYEQRARLAVDPDLVEVRTCGRGPDGRPVTYELRRYAQDGHAPGWEAWAGRVVVDLAAVARRVAACEGSWRHTLRLAPEGLRAVATPIRCGDHRWCPHCAGALASSRARLYRAAIERARAEGEAGHVALVTLTQRARAGESFESATGRLRRALRSLATSSAQARSWRRWWAAHVAGHVWSVEVTRGWPGHHEGAERPRARAALWWHAHAHLVVVLRPGVAQEEAAQAIGERWEALTARESGADGWDPVASGGVSADRRLWARGGWWRELELEDLSAVYQACKYLTKPAALDGQDIVELATWAHGARWHGRAGLFRGLADLDQDQDQDQEGDEGRRPDLGRLLAGVWSSQDICDLGDRLWPLLAADVGDVRAALAGSETEGPQPRLEVGPCDRCGGGHDRAECEACGGTGERWRVRARASWAWATATAADLAVARADVGRLGAAVERGGADPRRWARLRYAVERARALEGDAREAAAAWRLDAWEADPDGVSEG